MSRHAFDDDDLPFDDPPAPPGARAPALDLQSQFVSADDPDDDLPSLDDDMPGMGVEADFGEWRSIPGMGDIVETPDRERQQRLSAGAAALARLMGSEASESAFQRIFAEVGTRFLTTFFPKLLASRVALARKAGFIDDLEDE
ncbi:hypothetical protein V5F40_21540 [Xanthobacter sp. DSM 14520]|uniref:hypothetical protein n=1 Tax=Xanthobacter autotrophicus (strain ATCC BAA-1158 / Py2) TaxID=78245 RepID=UPI003728DF94